MAPYMTPWSVRPIAGISSSSARWTIAPMRLAPSSSEYSVWLWRWTKVFGACGIVLARVGGTPPASLLCTGVAPTIRLAVSTDQRTIRALVRSAGINPMNLAWPNFLVAEEDGAVVGIGQVKTHGDGSRELASMVVVPERRGQGIGRALIESLIDRYPHEVLHLTCRRELGVYYERFGFRRLVSSEYTPYFR